MKKILLLCVTAFFSSVASANDQYFEVDYMMLTQTADVSGSGSIDANPPSFSAKFGSKLSNNLALEGVLGLGISDDSYGSESGGGITVSASGKLNTLFGANLVGIIPIAGATELFGKVGVVRIDSELSATVSGAVSASGSQSYDDTGISYGFGIKVGINNNSGVVLEYVKYPDIDAGGGLTIKTTTINIGYRGNF